MKYIRTKDGRIGVYLNKQIGNCHRIAFKETIETIYDDEIIKQADTIEELCDVYVMNHGFGPYLVYIDELDGHAMGQTKEMLLSGQLEAYGAIWVFDSNGAPTLKPVAKMNGKGELEL